MKKILWICFFYFLSAIYSTQSIYASQSGADASAQVKQENTAPEEDIRIEKLQSFLETYDSALSSHVDLLITLADTYNLPWTLVPAIAGVESGFCRRIPKIGNCWGWNNGASGFSNLEQAIFIVTRAIRYKYYDRGLDTPYKMSKVYAPPSGTWAGKVSYFMQAIENTRLDSSPPIDL